MTDEELRRNRAIEEEGNLDLALKQLEAVLAPSLAVILDKAKDPLQQACLIIGHFMKIGFFFPRNAIESSSFSMKKRIELICQRSGIQKRKIKLEGKWWKQNHGSFLTFSKESNQPVAIIRLNKYKLIDKDRNEYVTDEIAATLSDEAYMFYRHFDPNLKSGREAIRFFSKNYYKELFSIIPIAFLGVIYALFPPVATNLLFSYAVPQSDPPLVLYLTFGLLFSAVGFAFFYLLQEFVYLKMEGLASHLLQTAFWDRLLKLSPRFFRKYTVGNLFWRVFSIEEIRTLMSEYGSSFAITTIFALLYLMMMLIYAPLLALFAVSFALIGIGISFACSFYKIRVLREALEVDGNLRGVVIQMIGGLGKLRVAGVDKSAFAHWARYFAINNSLKMKVQNIHNLAMVATGVLPYLSTWIIYLALLEWMGTQAISLPNFLAFNIAFGSFSLAIYPLCQMIVNLADVFPLWERTQAILEEPLEQVKQGADPGLLTGDIRIENVVFGYDPNRPPVLNNVSLVIKPKEFIGIVGKSGCGKSTLVRLLLGFEKPASGIVYLNDADLFSFDLPAVRRQLGVVLQGGGVVAGSIYEVLSAGGSYTQEEFNQALELSGFDEDLATFPMGLNTVVPMNAVTFSAGQKQRLLLAKALMGSPSLLIFDEATSALDNKSQDKIIQNIEQMNVTRIAIAQRLSTIKKADRIYVIDEGMVMQQGTFEELAKAPGLFKEMLERQKV